VEKKEDRNFLLAFGEIDGVKGEKTRHEYHSKGKAHRHLPTVYHRFPPLEDSKEME